MTRGTDSKSANERAAEVEKTFVSFAEVPGVRGGNQADAGTWKLSITRILFYPV